jgi:hypothetical protein
MRFMTFLAKSAEAGIEPILAEIDHARKFPEYDLLDACG